MRPLGLALDARRRAALRGGLPLDSLPVPVFAALGLRRLLSTYAGPLARARRSSDNAQEDFGAGPDGWLDTAALLAWTGTGNSAFAVTLYDQSGNGRHVTQNGMSAQRRLVTAGALHALNGRPVDSGASGQFYTSAWPECAQPMTVLATVRLPTYAAPADANFFRSSVGGKRLLPYISSPTRRVAAFAGGSVPMGPVLTDNAPYVLAWVFSGPMSFVGANDVYGGAGNAGAEPMGASPHVLSSQSAPGSTVVGNVGDLVLLQGGLTQAQLTALSRMMGAGYGIGQP